MRSQGPFYIISLSLFIHSLIPLLERRYHLTVVDQEVMELIVPALLILNRNNLPSTGVFAEFA